VERFHGEEKAEAAEAEFVKVHRARELPTEVPRLTLSIDFFPSVERSQAQYSQEGPEKVVVVAPVTSAERPIAAHIGYALVGAGFCKSGSEARRLVEQGGVRVNGQKVDSGCLLKPDQEYLIQAGKRHFKRVRVEIHWKPQG
jgi:tyrosyl-tRNA synthetase